MQLLAAAVVWRLTYCHTPAYRQYDGTVVLSSSGSSHTRRPSAVLLEAVRTFHFSFLAAPPLAFPAGDWGIPGQGLAYQAPFLPDLFSSGAEEGMNVCHETLQIEYQLHLMFSCTSRKPQLGLSLQRYEVLTASTGSC